MLLPVLSFSSSSISSSSSSYWLEGGRPNPALGEGGRGGGGGGGWGLLPTTTKQATGKHPILSI